MNHLAVRPVALSAIVAAALLATLPLIPNRAPSVLEGVAPAEPVTLAQGNKMLASQSAAFIENRGQWDAQAKFLARTSGANVWITDNGAVFDFFKTQGSATNLKSTNENQRSRKGHVVRMEFVGASPIGVEGVNQLEGRLNYFIGTDRSKWASNVLRYEEARTSRLYDGVDVRYYFDQGRPRYDLIVAPGTDPSKIAMRFEGADGLSAEGTALRIGTSLGAVEQRGLFAYQKAGSSTKQVPCSFDVRGNTVRFALGAYDRSRPLVIDPLLWSTFLGGNGSDTAYGVCIDPSNRPVITGYTASSNFPVSAGSYDISSNGNGDIFVAKLSSNGASLEFGTFVGGSSSEQGNAVALDSVGNVLVAGQCDAAGFPTTIGAFDTTYNGGIDVVVLKLSADGSGLIFATYAGAGDEDKGLAIDVDSSDRPVFGGYNKTGAFPVTAGSYDNTFNGLYDGIVGRLSADGTALEWCTYLGGGTDDAIRGLQVDSLDRVYVAGYSLSSDFPTTTGPAIASSYNGFVSRLSASGAALQASIVLGGSGADSLYCLALDPTGGVWAAGRTDSSNLPVTTGVYDEIHNGLRDGWVAKFASNLDELYITYLGGSFDDEIYAIGVDSNGSPVVAGGVGSADFPTTAGAAETSNDGSLDAFVSKLSPTASQLLYSTYLGGGALDNAHALAVDSAGNTVVVGETSSPTFPTTFGALDTVVGTVPDGWVARIATAPTPYQAQFPGTKVIGGFSAQLTIDFTQPVVTDTLITLSTDNPAKIFPNVTTKIKAGQSQKKVGIRTETVKTDTFVTVFASYNGITVSDTLTLQPGGLLTLKLATSSIVGGNATTGTVTLSGPAQKDRTVVLSSNSAAAMPDASAVVTTGTTSKAFNVLTNTVSTDTVITVSGTLGTMTKTDTMTVKP